ncbi:uncharacterized protein GLRG_08717 [Colletotrichum graminicola M1.001]|uniref:Uncharacterized protein n=1 Tax=Colletotrichum graminicola (strain M1.001 / M2 / FGSC 10212) TaxID=645133 RepID=E3QRF0_COLGM|nr:uncharacterized protein GLRG_08717 [Colletotrichum graminicola M1.001]EFQ33438.1 hypothetical protein GLRG_08717 [Colletotrichum graminicola M1.001]
MAKTLPTPRVDRWTAHLTMTPPPTPFTLRPASRGPSCICCIADCCRSQPWTELVCQELVAVVTPGGSDALFDRSLAAAVALSSVPRDGGDWSPGRMSLARSRRS